MNRILFLTAILCLVFNITYAQDVSVVGYWLTEEGDSQIKIFKASNGKYFGNIVWLKTDPEAKDKENPNPKLKERRILNLQILQNFSWSPSKKEWNGGTIYDPSNGNTYSCYMWFDGDKNKLNIKGYILGMRFLGRETEWTRENNNRL